MKKRTQENSLLNKLLIAIIFVTLGIYTVSMFFPLLWGLLTSLKSQGDFFLDKNVLGFPNLDPEIPWNSRETCFELLNYKIVIDNFQLMVDVAKTTFYSAGKQVYHEATGGIAGIFANTFIYVFIGAFVNTIWPAVAAYATAKFNFKFSNVLYTFLLITMIIPIVGSQSTTINVLQTLGIYDTWFGYIALKSMCTGMYYFVFYGFYKSLPDSYAEAAEIDGAGHWNILFRIVIPLSVKQLATVWLVHFVGFWNDYQTPLLYLPSKPTLAYTVWYLTLGSVKLGDMPTMVAGTMTLALPILLVFIFLKNRLMGNVSIGGLKE